MVDNDPALIRKGLPVQPQRDIRDHRSHGTRRDHRASGSKGLGQRNTQNVGSERRSPTTAVPTTSNVKDIRNMEAQPSHSRPQQGIKDVRNMAAVRPGTVDLRNMKAATPSADRPPNSYGLRPGAVRPALKPRGSVQERSVGPPRERMGAQRQANEATDNIGDRSTLRREKRAKRQRSLIENADAKADGPQYSEEEMAYMKERDEALELKETPYIPAAVTLESLAEYMPSLATGTMGMQHTVRRGFDRMIFNASLDQHVEAPPMEFLSLDEARKRDALVARKEKEKDDFEPRPLTEQQLDILLGKLLPEMPDVSEQAKAMSGGQIVSKLLHQVNRNPSYTPEDSVALAKRFKRLLPGGAAAKPKPVSRP